MKFSIIAETDKVILGGSLESVTQALKLAQAGQKVCLITQESFLGSDIALALDYETEERKLLHPDVFKRDLEEQCLKQGVTLFYFMWPVDSKRLEDGRILLRTASKGGLFAVLCHDILDYRGKVEDLSYRAYAKRPTEEEWSLLEVKNVGIPGQSPALNLLACHEALLETFATFKQKDNRWGLGHFALRGFGPENKHQADWLGNELYSQSFTVEFQDELQNYKKYPLIEGFSGIYMDERHFDLVVLGGGTAGVMAAIHAGRQGLRTLIVEPNFVLGGTATVGGVHGYWFGKRYKDVEEIDQGLALAYERFGLENKPGIWGDFDNFHAGVRNYVYLKLCLEAGVELYLGQLAYGVVKDRDDRLCGIATIGEEGRILCRGKLFFDATGDGDIAYAAGAAASYGNYRDAISYWASLAQYSSPDSYKNNFSCMVYTPDPVDYTDFIIKGRKRGERTYDHGSYVSPRESRHIKGQYELTLRDLMTYKTYADGLYTCFSNYDPKGKVTADIIYAGILPQQSKIQIPLSSLLCVDKENKRIEKMYVLGKAISASHNIFPSIRMQTDLMHQGSVMGELAAEAIKYNISIEDIDQDRRRAIVLQRTGDSLIMPEPIDFNKDTVDKINKDTRSNWVDVSFLYEERDSNPIIALMCADPALAIPQIEARLKKEEDPTIRMLLIWAALWHGDERWTEELLEHICRQIDDVGAYALPKRQGSVQCAQLLPDHGVMPEVIYAMQVLAWSKKDSLLRPFCKLMERLKKTDRDYSDIRKGFYHYIEVFPYVAERTGKTDFVELLKRLLRFPELREAIHLERSDLMSDRLQILLLIIYRALARLGDREGYEGLVRLIDECPTSLSLSACMELRELTGKNYGYDTDTWVKFIKNTPNIRKIQPVSERYW